MLSTIFDETIDEKFAKKRPSELKPEEFLEVFENSIIQTRN
jgi:hypothetical protein